LWLAKLDVGDDVVAYAFAHGRPIRYRHVERDWPITAYESIFGREPGSAEMPSASRPFTNAVVTDLVTRGVLVTPLLLHTGVSSLEGGERPYPERYRVPSATAANINAVHRSTGRVIAVGTTVVRALATVTDERGVVHPGEGWTDVVVTPDAPVASVDGLLTGWHEPESSHLMMLDALASADALRRAYEAAFARGYLWHEFGDSHLILRAGTRP
jgi:S-adenosylmethionine:tRNA ribosyltransferase-isomerase